MKLISGMSLEDETQITEKLGYIWRNGEIIVLCDNSFGFDEEDYILARNDFERRAKFRGVDGFRAVITLVKTYDYEPGNAIRYFTPLNFYSRQAK